VVRALPRALALITALVLPATPGSAQEITRKVGLLTIRVDETRAVPGGVMVVWLSPPLGTTYAILDGFRIQFETVPHGPRALMPIPVTAAPGPRVLGIELVTRSGGRERIAMDVAIGPRTYARREVVIPEARRSLLADPAVVRQSRVLLEALRTHSDKTLWNRRFLSPVGVEPTASFGAAETYPGLAGVDSRMDSVYGEYHRGVDYQVPAGVTLIAPGSGTVLLAEPLVLTGETLVIDHGQGVVSAFFHMGHIDVAAGTTVEAGQALGVAGDTGLVPFPLIHWGLYLHGVAVDPFLLGEALGE
jgi:murein DD-endopeptidase MepM/ murein hydrolase activator NlpD